jgi:hypothetical protein
VEELNVPGDLEGSSSDGDLGAASNISRGEEGSLELLEDLPGTGASVSPTSNQAVANSELSAGEYVERSEEGWRETRGKWGGDQRSWSGWPSEGGSWRDERRWRHQL